MSEPSQLVTQCLRDLHAGDEGALERMMPLVYEDLRGLARGIQRKQAHSLNPTALVHEAFARLVGAGAKEYEGRKHFMKVAAIAMRQLLINHARDRQALKRGGEHAHVTLKTGDALEKGDEVDAVALEEALARFEASYPRQAKVVELRFLAGLGVEEAAEALDVSPRTVKLDWQMAKAWLSRELRRDETS